jgi:CheY-like chemotaxis protein
MPMAKVLLVDANQDRPAALPKALVEAGYEVAAAPSGLFAVGALERERPDLVVRYAQVQDMDGYELFTHVRKDPTTMDTPFLLLAGRDRPIALAAAEAGAEMTVTGDFTFEMVVGGVQNKRCPRS